MADVSRRPRLIRIELMQPSSLPAPHVSVEPVTSENWRAVAALQVKAEQREYVNPPVFNLALCQYSPSGWSPLAVRAGDQIVGFLMWAIDPEDASCWVGGVMVDATFQGLGYGRQAMVAAVAEAVACAQAGAFLISPFVGRITDWYKQAEGRDGYPVEDDPGVRSVRTIYTHFKTHGYPTVVMGASFRSAMQVEALAGCDRLTVSPTLLAELDADHGPLHRQLSASAQETTGAEAPLTEAAFRWALVDNQMAGEKLTEGIRTFHLDYVRLHSDIAAQVTAHSAPRVMSAR